jgi:hypothetical protein
VTATSGSPPVCERSFLKFWTYPDPHNDGGHERCDLLAAFGDTVFWPSSTGQELADIPREERQGCGTAESAMSSTVRSRLHGRER